MIKCIHWSDCGVNHGGCCGLNLYGGKPSHGVCRKCPHSDKITGLGDVVALATRAVGIKPCPACKERQAKLNGIFKSSNAHTGNNHVTVHRPSTR